jgi:hypothetical protein
MTPEPEGLFPCRVLMKDGEWQVPTEQRPAGWEKLMEPMDCPPEPKRKSAWEPMRRKLRKDP